MDRTNHNSNLAIWLWLLALAMLAAAITFVPMLVQAVQQTAPLMSALN